MALSGSKVHCVSGMSVADAGNVFCCSADDTSSRRESFTVWMKSLVMQGNGCTVFNEGGEVVYRMDNYDTRHSTKVYLMDLRGRVLFTILKKKLRIFGCWQGYKSANSHSNDEKIWFRVSKSCCILREKLSCKVTLFSGKTRRGYCSIEGFAGKLDFKIKDSNEVVIAEAKRKQTSSGVYLGDDVLTLVIEPHVDHSFIVALVAVYGSMCNRM